VSVTILVERNGIRAYTTVNSESTRIPGVSRTHWMGPRTRDTRDYYSLTHLVTGRSLNKVPLTADECDRLVDALLDCPIEWERIVPEKPWPGREWYVDRLTDEAKQLAGAY
jgi:hypothetical protein